MLYDVLTYPEGPRIRDRISHGEVDLSTVSQDVARHVIQITVILCLQKIQQKSLLQVCASFMSFTCHSNGAWKLSFSLRPTPSEVLLY
jgi:hypothetical protein